MPTVKYYSKATKIIVVDGKRNKVQHVTCVSKRIRNADDLAAIETSKSFVRWRCGNLTMATLIQRRKARVS